MNFIKDRDFGENVHLVCSDEKSAVLRIANETGEGMMSFHSVFPGCVLGWQDHHMERAVSGSIPDDADMLCIDHCRDGRLEWEVRKNCYSYVEAGDAFIDSRKGSRSNFRFPLGHYRGITIAFDMKEASGYLSRVEGFPVDLYALRDRFCSGGRSFSLRGELTIEHIFSELYCVPDSIRDFYMKLKVLELLLFLDTVETNSNSDERPYFYKTQVDKARAIQKYMTGDLSSWHTLEELSEKFDFPVTSMKKCFKGIYGSSIAHYMKEYRMNSAALRLRDTDEPIIDIATDMGYDNPGKFSAAFRSVMGMTPREWRNSAVGDEH